MKFIFIYNWNYALNRRIFISIKIIAIFYTRHTHTNRIAALLISSRARINFLNLSPANMILFIRAASSIVNRFFANLVFYRFSRFLSRSRRSNELILSIPPAAPLRPVLPFFVIRYSVVKLSYRFARKNLSSPAKTKRECKKKEKK